MRYAANTSRFNWGGNPLNVKQVFADTSDTTAITVTPSEPFKSFWQPAYQGPDPSYPNDPRYTGFGVGIDPSNNGVNIYNESNLFHEARADGSRNRLDDQQSP